MAKSQMQLEDWLDDLCVRFIINLPQEDLSSVARICFQVEEAQWFYEDFIRPLDPILPSMTLRTFCLRIFQHCPLLANFSVENHTKAFEEFLEYKTRVPVRGAIMLNKEMDSTVLVKGWKKGANWSFPRGKINKDEDDLDCAIREVYEETGLDLRAAGLVPADNKVKYIEVAMREQHMRLYVFRDVPMETRFEPKTRKEISKIEWYNLSELPAFRRKHGQAVEANPVPNANKFYMVAPFLAPLKKWVVMQKKLESKRSHSGSFVQGHHNPIDEVLEDEAWTQNDTGAESSRTPAIETLAGATHELQRLLKLQPATQGLQPPAPAPAPVPVPVPRPQDKGSALLSILQAKGSGPPQPAAQLPHTPFELTVGEAPQARTPHHHQNHQHPIPTINTQQPPPNFPIAPNQVSLWGQAQQQPFNHQYPIPPQDQFANHSAPLVHPQPLPPQVQRAVFNRSAFQESQQPQYAGAQAPIANPGQRPVQLNGDSMALLNAFKTGGNPAAQKENYMHAHGGVPQGYVGNDGQPGPPQHIPIPATYAAMSSQPSPKELAGSKVVPPANEHRSALLGMFKTASPSQSPPVHNPQGVSSPSSGLMPLGGNNHAKPHVSSPLSLQGLSIQPRPDQAPNAQQHDAPQVVSQPPQPVRILQRGQTEQHLGGTQQSLASPQMQTGGLAGQASVYAASPQTAASFPSPGVAYRRPESGADQKRQLLSLFGKQQRPPSSLEGGKGKEVVPDMQMPRITSLASGVGELGGGSSPSRRGSQTPISPADRSFLLGYLESVTNNASR